jgi:argininosuccinate lyase
MYRRVTWVLFSVLLVSLFLLAGCGETVDPEKVTEAQQEEQLTPEEQAAADHQEWAKAQFSPWDGAHHELVRVVKKGMNDPGSFEHVETKVLVIKKQEHIDTIGQGKFNDLYIHMTFRGKNAFGGTIVSGVDALVEYDSGNVTLLSDF